MIIFMFLYKYLKHQDTLEFYLKVMDQNRIRSFLASHRHPMVSTRINPLDQRSLQNALEEREGWALQWC